MRNSVFLFILLFSLTCQKVLAVHLSPHCDLVLNQLSEKSHYQHLKNPETSMNDALEVKKEFDKLTFEQKLKIKIPHFEAQLPSLITRLRNAIDTNNNNKKLKRYFYLHDEKGQTQIENVSNVEEALTYLLNEAELKLKNHDVTYSWYLGFVNDSLFAIEAATKEFRLPYSFSRLSREVENYIQGEIAPEFFELIAGKQNWENTVSQYPLIFKQAASIEPSTIQAHRLAAAKKIIYSMTAQGFMYWPTFADLEFFHFWGKFEQGIFPAVILEGENINYDEQINVSAANYFSHDLTGHPLQWTRNNHTENKQKFIHKTFELFESIVDRLTPQLQSEIKVIIAATNHEASLWPSHYYYKEFSKKDILKRLKSFRNPQSLREIVNKEKHLSHLRGLSDIALIAHFHSFTFVHISIILETVFATVIAKNPELQEP
ncbi:MAG: hypothetical protein SGI74_10180 [Oligoflexia bacterium]|nr:hypothetical protein [Oligoflexia bacterium]